MWRGWVEVREGFLLRLYLSSEELRKMMGPCRSEGGGLKQVELGDCVWSVFALAATTEVA